MRSYFIETWGCQMNHHDSERLAGRLRSEGLTPAASATEADLILLNTCSVREKPVQKIRSRLGEIGRENASAVVGVCGCVAQQEGSRLLERSPVVGFVLGPGQLNRLEDAVRRLKNGTRSVFTGFDAESEYNFHTIFRKSSTRGMVTVIEGCNEHCTFCIVPYTRGPEKSRPVNDILTEIRSLAATGVREVELLGQTINAYRCPESEADLAQLLTLVGEVPGVERIRFITSHPRHFSGRLIDAMASNPKVSRYLHLPVQAGANAVLKRMHRRYTREEYLELVGRLRAAIPDLNLSTDIIVGFPGESDSDFQQTIDLLEEVRFGQVFAFAFSPRSRTPAARYALPVPESVKKQRLSRLFACADRITGEINQTIVGRTLRVLIDGDSRRSPQDWQGRTDDNRVVNFPKINHEKPGDFVPVEIIRAGAHSLYGRLAGPRLHLPVIVKPAGSPVALEPGRV